MSAETWDIGTRYSANVNLSIDEKTVWVDTSAYAGIRTTTGKSSGKWYVELRSNGGWDQAVIGVCDDSAIAPTYPGGGGNSLGWGKGTSAFQTGACTASTKTADTVVDGDVYCLAIDATTGEVWLRFNNEAWKSGDPEAGTTPLGTAGCISSDIYITVSPYRLGNETTYSLTILSEAADLVYSPPVGFLPWGEVLSSVETIGVFSLLGGVAVGSQPINPTGEFVLSGGMNIVPTDPVLSTMGGEFVIGGGIDIHRSPIEVGGRFNLIGGVDLPQEGRFSTQGQFLLQGAVEGESSSPVFAPSGRFVLSGVMGVGKSSVAEVGGQFLLSGTTEILRESSLAIDGQFILSGRTSIGTEGQDCSLPDNSARWC